MGGDGISKCEGCFSGEAQHVGEEGGCLNPLEIGNALREEGQCFGGTSLEQQYLATVVGGDSDTENGADPSEHGAAELIEISGAIKLIAANQHHGQVVRCAGHRKYIADILADFKGAFIACDRLLPASGR